MSLARLVGPDLRRSVVQRRLVHMRELLGVLEGFGRPTGQDLRNDIVVRLAVERALAPLVELAVKINSHVPAAAGLVLAEDYFGPFASASEAGLLDPELAARLAPSAGLRNRVVHEYDEVDLDIVAVAVTEAAFGDRSSPVDSSDCDDAVILRVLDEPCGPPETPELVRQ